MTWHYLGKTPDEAPLLLRLASVARRSELLRGMAERDLRMRYGGSALGLLWTVIQPLLLVGLYTGIFTFVFQARLAPQAPVEQYALHVVVGLLPWLAVAGVLTKATEVMAEQRALVKQVIFPVEILPIYGIGPALLAQLVGLGAVLALVWALRGGLHPLVLALPLVLVGQIALMAGLAWALGAVGALLRDVKEAVQVLLMLGMFLTPIFYVESMLPRPLRLVVDLNPMAHLIYVYRDLILESRIQHPVSVAVLAVLAPLTLVAGFALFERTRAMLSDAL